MVSFNFKYRWCKGRRKKLGFSICLILFLMYVARVYYLANRVSNELYLEHFRRNRNLSHYMDSISIFMEPSTTACDSLSEVPLLVLVTSAPHHFEHRKTLRETWGSFFPTYFVLGLNNQNIRLEAEQHNDLIIYDFQDHYQNLTLKSVLMLRWTNDRCASLGFLLKIDDDMLVNPWIMLDILADNNNAKLIGFKKYHIGLYRDEYEKWYLPHWLYEYDTVPQYLVGPGYLIKGKYIKSILVAASEVPLINLEDIYITYLVASAKLGLELTNDPRLDSSLHAILLPCSRWQFAVTHGLKLKQIYWIWRGFVHIAKDYTRNKKVCPDYNFLGIFSH